MDKTEHLENMEQLCNF